LSLFYKFLLFIVQITTLFSYTLLTRTSTIHCTPKSSHAVLRHDKTIKFLRICKLPTLAAIGLFKNSLRAGQDERPV